MKILIFGDTHGITDFSYLYEMGRKADAIIHVGDLTDFGVGMDEALEGLTQLSQETNKPVILTHGNHETTALRDSIKGYSELVYVHQSVYKHDNLMIFGYGGGGFGSLEPRVEEFFSRAYADHSDSRGIHVWLFHGPPFDLEVDYRPDWGPTGSKTKRELIEKHKPHFVFVGHIHEAWGTIHEHENTVLVNPGPEGVLLDVEVTQK